MKEFELATSAIPAELTYNLMEHYDMAWAANRTPGLYRVVFFTIAEILKHYKSKSNPKVGFELKDTNGTFKFGAILSYHAPEDGSDDGDDDKGNYTLEFTMNEADMADNVIVLNDGKILAQASPTEIFSQTEMPRQIGLDIPFVDKLIYKLNQLGITIPKDVQTKDELKQYLCQLNSKK